MDTITGLIDFSNSLDTSYIIYFEVLECIDSYGLEIINLDANAGFDASICGFNYQLIGEPSFGSSYLWSSLNSLVFSPSDSIIDPMVNSDSSGFQTFILELSELKCSSTDSVEIYFSDSVWVNAGPDQNIYDSYVTLNAQSNGTEFQWQNLNFNGDIEYPDSLITTVNNLITGEYIFGITSNNNICPSDYDELIISVNLFFIPSGFSPNGDGINDLFIIEGVSYDTNFEIQITNRWGELVFISSDMNNGWDGRVNSKLAPEDTYFYFLRTYDQNFQGYIELKR